MPTPAELEEKIKTAEGEKALAQAEIQELKVKIKLLEAKEEDGTLTKKKKKRLEALCGEKAELNKQITSLTKTIESNSTLLAVLLAPQNAGMKGQN